jgi:ABC-type branched-subunit amino acid transport system substrate-binding protein
MPREGRTVEGMANRSGDIRTSGMSRRRLLGLTAAAGGWLVAGDLLAACGGPQAVGDAGDVGDIRIGFVSADADGLMARVEMERNCLRLAVEELNAAGGVGGRSVGMVEAAGKSAVERVGRLLGAQRADVIVGALGDADRAAVASQLDQHGGLLIDASPQAAAPCGRTLMSTGLVASQQMAPMVDWVVANVGRHVLILASAGTWSHSALAAVRAALRRHDEDPMQVRMISDDASLDAALAEVSRVTPEVLWSLLEGRAATRLATQLSQQGVSAMIVASRWDEVDAAANPSLLGGALTPQSWLMSLDTAESRDYVSRYQHRYGSGQRVSATGEAISVAVNLYAAAVKRAGGTAVGRVLQALPNVELRAARGSVRMDRASHVATGGDLYVGQISGDGTIDLHDKLPRPAPPSAGCPSR